MIVYPEKNSMEYSNNQCSVAVPQLSATQVDTVSSGIKRTSQTCFPCRVNACTFE